MQHLILVINPGSTSTKMALYKDDTEFKSTSVQHSREELALLESFQDQRDFRESLIMDWLNSEGISLGDLTAIAARGGFLVPLPGGTYGINAKMVDHLEQGVFGKHATNLAAPIAFDLSSSLGIPSYIVDPVVVDELMPEARISGVPGIERQSIFHALNHKASAKKTAKILRRPYEELNLIVAHLGGGISIAVHGKGKVIDVNNALSGEGPMSPERAGSLPTKSFIEYYFEYGGSKEELLKMLTAHSGLVAHLETNDLRVIKKKIKNGDGHAHFVFEAMCYQIAKEVGRIATVLRGIVDQIVLTGGLAYSDELIAYLHDRIGFIAPITVLPGENELEALALGVFNVLMGLEEVREYTM